jgi:hypothetical protein
MTKLDLTDQTSEQAERNRWLPTRTDLICIVIASIVVRVIVLSIAVHKQHIPLSQYIVDAGDGGSYVAYGQLLLGSKTHLTYLDLRLFPGTSMLIAALLAVKVPMAIASLGLCAGCSVVANVLAALLFQDKRIGYLMVAFIPDWLLVSTGVVSEAPLLAFTLAGLWMAMRRKGIASAAVGGLLLGFAGIIRPMACFALLGYFFVGIWQRQLARAMIVAAMSGLVVAATLIWLHFWLGDALHGVKLYAREPGAYGGHLFDFPGHMLLATPFSHSVPKLKILLVWGVAALLGAACVLAALNFRNSNRSGGDLLTLPWLLSNTFFIICVGSHWGFDVFMRLTLPALPAELFALRLWFPARYGKLACVLLWLACIGVAVVILTRRPAVSRAAFEAMFHGEATSP